MSYKDIARIIPAVQSIDLIKHDLKAIKKKKKTASDVISLGTRNLIGVSLIGSTSDLIGEL